MSWLFGSGQQRGVRPLAPAGENRLQRTFGVSPQPPEPPGRNIVRERMGIAPSAPEVDTFQEPVKRKFKSLVGS